MAVFVIVNYQITKMRQKYNDQMNQMDSKLGGVLADTISNNFNISLFSTHKREAASYRNLTQEWRSIFTKGWRLSAYGDAVLGMLMIFLEIGIFYLAIGYWREGKLTVGDFVLIQGLLVRVMDYLWSVGRIIRDVGRGMSDAREMIEVLETPHQIVDKPDAKDIVLSDGKIELKNLNFKYNDKKVVFKNFDLTIDPGKKIALVSKSGGGKTTIVRLLLRFYNVPENSIYIDGQDIMSVTQDSLRRNISLVPQDPVLFHRTLAENIAYSRPEATMEEIIAASKKAHCHEFIKRLPEGYNTYVGERGVKLSGGERQRVAIARAILEDAPILILDEATSALDSESEKLIQDALQELMKKKTTIAIAHRLSTISQMDEIIVLERGKIVDRGTHKELINRTGSHYKKLWDIQAGGFSE
jgi:ATP-binding cassette subfamily B protein